MDGVRQFVVGTGGKNLRPVLEVQPNSEADSDQDLGVLALTLKPSSYDWQFLSDGPFDDSGSGQCH